MSDLLELQKRLDRSVGQNLVEYAQPGKHYVIVHKWNSPRDMMMRIVTPIMDGIRSLIINLRARI